jgi:outer membrane lipoprotein-sorting protein
MARLPYGALSLCGMLLLLVGCRGVFSPRSQPPATVLSTAEPIWQQLAARRRAFHNLKGLAQIRWSNATHNVAFDETAVVLEGFEALRLEGIGPLGQPLFLLIADGQRFSLYTPQEQRLISGPASARNLERAFGLALAPEALQYLLLGDIPLVTLPEAGKVAYRRRENLYVWEGEGTQAGEYYRVWFAPSHLQPVSFVMEDRFGRAILQVQYEDFRQLDGFRLPYRITAVQPLAEQHVVWHYSEARLNTTVPPALFRLRVPAGTKQVELD